MVLALLFSLGLIGAVVFALARIVRLSTDGPAGTRAVGAVIGAGVGTVAGVMVVGLSWSSLLVTVVIGILAGLLAGEWATSEPTPATRGASLRARRLTDYASWPWLVLPMIGLAADAGVIAIGLRPHPTGAASATCDGITWQAWLRWPSRPTLLAAAIASVLLVALLGAILRRIVRRPQTVRPGDDVTDDDTHRALSARQAIALTAAGQLLVFAGVAWRIGHGYVTPCQDRPALTAGALAVGAFAGAIGMLLLAGRDSRRPAPSRAVMVNR